MSFTSDSGTAPEAPPAPDDNSLNGLERKKLLAEIDELKRPLWRRPAFLGVLGPTLLAAGSLGYAIWTGSEFLDLERSRLENDKTLLEIQNTQAQQRLNTENQKLEEARLELELARTDVAKAEAQLQSRAAEIEVELSETQKKFDADLAAQQDRFDRALSAEKDALNLALDRERRNFITEKSRLTSQLDELREHMASRLEALDIEVKDREQRLADLQEQLRAPETFTLLKNIREGDDAIWQNQSMEKLIELAQASPTTRDLVVDAAEKATDPLYRAGLLYLLHKADPNPERFGQFLAHLDDNPTNADVWELFAFGYWDAPDQRQVLRRLFQEADARKIADETLEDILSFFFLPKLPLSDLAKELASPEGRAFVSQTLSLSFNSAPNNRRQMNATRATATLHPALGLAHVLLVRDERLIADLDAFRITFRDDIAELESAALEEAAEDLAARYADLGGALFTRDLPNWIDAATVKALQDAIAKGDVEAAVALVR